MAVSLKGTVALVTGASSGIGMATALDLAARGAAVALVARRVDRLTAVADRITADGGAAQVIEADVTDNGQVHAAVEQAADRAGRLDILINNAGVTRRSGADDMAIADWERIVSVNLMGALYVAHAALPHLLRAAEDGPRQVADLVNVSSWGSLNARKRDGVYGATKRALNGFSESLRQELAGRRVRVSVLIPASVETELFPPEVRAKHDATRGFPPLEAEDVADAIGYAVTRPAHVAVSELLIRPSGHEL